MMLLLDGGNSLVKWGVRDRGCWCAQGAVGYAELEALEAVLDAFAIRKAIGVNVAGPGLAQHLGPVLDGRGVSLEWVRSSAACCGVINAYRRPETLGADRWAALIGARGLHPGACVVVCAGTATTVDVLAPDGVFRGGLILPGERLMRRALSDNTAQLPFAEGRFETYPQCTEDAIVSGCRQAQLGAVERVFGSIADEADPICLLSGGAAEALAGLLRVPCRPVENLVLEGLARIAETTGMLA